MRQLSDPISPQSPSRTTRATISFPTEIYLELERIAEAKKVSVAWVVREAAEKYLDAQWPLFGGERSAPKP